MTTKFDTVKILSPRRNTTEATNIDELINEQLDHFGIDHSSEYGKAMYNAVEDIYNTQHSIQQLWNVYSNVTSKLDKNNEVEYFNAKRFLSFQIAKVLDTLQNPFRKSLQNLNQSDQTLTAKGPFPIIDNVTALFSATPVITRTATYIYACTEWIDDAFQGKEFLHEIYSRLLNPTSISLANHIVELEAGAYASEYMAWNYNSGMAAIDGLFNHILDNNDILIVSRSIYGGTYQLLHDFYAREDRLHIKIEWFDGFSGEEFEVFLDEVKERNLDRLSKGSTIKAYIESPSNPEGYVFDVPAISAVCHKNGIQISVDSTVATPFLFKPLNRKNKLERPDYVVHSYTKDIAGLGNTTAGVVIGENHNMFIPKGLSMNGVSWEKTMFWNVYYIKGAFLDSDKSFEILNGFKTLPQRMLQKCINTAIFCEVLNRNKYININCNTIKEHKNHKIKEKILKYGLPAPLFTMDFEGLDINKSVFKKFFDSLSPAFNFQISLGQTNTTISCPALTTHSEMDASALKKAGLYYTTMRVSIGNENPKDLIRHFMICAKRTIGRVHPDFLDFFPTEMRFIKLLNGNT